jgi:hypothetical protein
MVASHVVQVAGGEALQQPVSNSDINTGKFVVSKTRLLSSTFLAASPVVVCLLACCNVIVIPAFFVSVFGLICLHFLGISKIPTCFLGEQNAIESQDLGSLVDLAAEKDSQNNSTADDSDVSGADRSEKSIAVDTLGMIQEIKNHRMAIDEFVAVTCKYFQTFEVDFFSKKIEEIKKKFYYPCLNAL